MDTWRLIHILAIAWLGAGLGSTWPMILRAWSEKKDVRRQAQLLIDAANNETRILLPGAMLTGTTGFFWAVAQERNFVKEGWLLALSVLFVFFYFICLPLLGWGLRRARIAALISQKKGEITPELQTILDDRVPVVFSTLLVLSVPLLAWIAIFKPF